MDKKVGRKPGSNYYIPITYNLKKYIIGILKSNGENVYFIIDYEDYNLIKDNTWHKSSNGYISQTIYIDGNKKELYMHNVIMGRDAFNGKGQLESIDHINRIGYDNRKENLRLATQSEQNFNQKQKQRNITLPEDCDIKLEDIPKHIWLVKPNGGHDYRFAIELKSENFCWKTTSSKAVSLKDKLQLAKDKLKELYKIYPHLDPDLIEKSIKPLADSYYKIVSFAIPSILPIIEERKIEEKIEEKIELINEIIQPIPQPHKQEITIPKQWKMKQIYEYIHANNAEPYKTWCASANNLSGDEWNKQFEEFRLKVLTFGSQEEAEETIRDFVISLRKKRHDVLVQARNDIVNPIEREDRQQWPSATILKAYNAGKIDTFKEWLDTQDESKDDAAAIKRWSTFTKSLQDATSDKDRQEIISKFLTARRTRLYRAK